MQKKKPELDIIDKVLDACYKANPDALFTMSLMHQYEERGWLTKKQLEGLYSKAKKIKELPGSWLATLEATLLKMPDRDKSPVISTGPVYSKNAQTGKWIEAILARYPQHKRVLFLQSRYANNEMFSAEEITELQKFYRLLVAKGPDAGS
ncbi:MAG: hypothetical protein NVSMB63_01410 [Sediminibacterium sp.]